MWSVVVVVRTPARRPARRVQSIVTYIHVQYVDNVMLQLLRAARMTLAATSVTHRGHIADTCTRTVTLRGLPSCGVMLSLCSRPVCPAK